MNDSACNRAGIAAQPRRAIARQRPDHELDQQNCGGMGAGAIGIPWGALPVRPTENNAEERPVNMKKTTKLTCAAAAAIAVCLMLQTPSRLFGDDSPQGAADQGGTPDHHMRIIFNKCQTSPGILQGTVDGDCGPGTIYFQQLPGTVVGTEVVRFAGEYTITTAQCSFKAVCAGIRFVSTGQILLNGVVIESSQGPNVGDRVRVDAQLLFEQGVRCSAGTMTVTPFHPDQDQA